MKKTHVIIILLVLAAVVVGAIVFYSFFSKEKILPNPRSLVPASTDLYAETASLDEINKVLADISSVVQVPVSLSKMLSSVDLPILADPIGGGVDTGRPLGFTAKISMTEGNSSAAFIPISNIELAAKSLKIDLKGIRNGVVTSGKYSFTFKNSYLIISENPKILTDLLALKKLGIEISERKAGSLVNVTVTKNLIRQADSQLAEFEKAVPQGAKIGIRLAKRIIEDLNSLSTDFVWNNDGLNLSTNFQFRSESLFPKILKTEDKLVFLDSLPSAACISGLSMNEEPSKKLTMEFIDIVKDLFDIDSGSEKILQSSMDLFSGEIGAAIIEMNAMDPSKMKLVSVQAIPEGREDNYLKTILSLQKVSTELWSKIMKGGGQPGSTMEIKDLPIENYGEVEVHSVSINTFMDIPIPPGADSKTIELLEKMRHQTAISRYAVVKNISGRSLMLSVSGMDTGILLNEIALLKGENKNIASTNSSVTKVIKMFEPQIAGYLLFNPMFFSGSTESKDLFGLSAKAKGNVIELNFVAPKEHIKGLAERIKSSMFGNGVIGNGFEMH